MAELTLQKLKGCTGSECLRTTTTSLSGTTIWAILLIPSLSMPLLISPTTSSGPLAWDSRLLGWISIGAGRFWSTVLFVRFLRRWIGGRKEQWPMSRIKGVVVWVCLYWYFSYKSKHFMGNSKACELKILWVLFVSCEIYVWRFSCRYFDLKVWCFVWL